jgi:hypothetical protein
VDDRGAQRAFGGVVGRFDTGVGGEGPERGPDLEQVVGEASVVAGARALAAGVLEELSWLCLDRLDVGLQLLAVVVVVLVCAPRFEQSAGELKPLLAEGLLIGQPSLWRRKSRRRCDQQTWR